MTPPGKSLYERYRKHEASAVHWNYLDQETREFWERLATTLHATKVLA